MGMSGMLWTIGVGTDWYAVGLVRWPLTVLYVLVLLLVSVYGLHRYWLVWLYYSHRGNSHRCGRFERLPRVTVQLPMFNEGHVAERVIDSACNLLYPLNLLQIQVLDDSTDACAQITRDRVAYWAKRGVDIQWLHREDRQGFKAGALAAAMPAVTGEFVAIFDADFLPPSGFLKRTIHHFTDHAIGMVQAKWGHLNRDDSLLTRSQAIFLDGHFVIEHTARNRSSRWINFNGTAGVWRRSAIESAGGWQHDTLTEDVDLSYRAQLAGWRFVFLPRVGCPAEIPPEINAFKAQQHRWTKGSIQTAIKLLPTVMRSSASLGTKVEAFFHLTSPMVYLYVSLMAVLFYPVLRMNMEPIFGGVTQSLLLGMTLVAMGTASACVFYTASQREQRRALLPTVLLLPALMSIGIGIALNNARACIEALIGHQSDFVRTPKYNRVGRTPRRGDVGVGDRHGDPPAAPPDRHRILATPSIKVWMSLIEIMLGLYVLWCMTLAWRMDNAFISTPFLLLFASGYLYVGLWSLWGLWSSRYRAGMMIVQPS